MIPIGVLYLIALGSFFFAVFLTLTVMSSWGGVLVLSTISVVWGLGFALDVGSTYWVYRFDESLFRKHEMNPIVKRLVKKLGFVRTIPWMIAVEVAVLGGMSLVPVLLAGTVAVFPIIFPLFLFTTALVHLLIGVLNIWSFRGELRYGH